MTTVPDVSPVIGGRYQILSLLGRGAMGEVYRVFDLLTRQQVALKRVLIQQQFFDYDSMDLSDRHVAITQEFQTLASLRHQHIISVVDYGFDQERSPYFTMDLLDQPQTILAASAGRSTNEKVQLLIQALQALAYLHRRGVLHRDIKPANIMVIDGTVKLVDFGLALAKTAATDSRVLGTLAYMAPEVLRGEPLGPATDLYAIGVIAYEMFAGRHPFNLNNVDALLTDILDTQPDLSPLLNQNAPERVPAFVEPGAVGQPSTRLSPEAENPGTASDEKPVSKTVQMAPERIDRSPTTHITLKRTAILSSPPTQRLPDRDEQPELHADSPDSDPAATQLFQQETERPTREAERTTIFDDLRLKSATLYEETTAFPDEPATLAGVIRKLLSKQVQNRYADANAVIAQLNAVIGEPPPPETEAIRESFLQAARFVGREMELLELSFALSTTSQGRGSLWLIGGESGVGKSRLLDELRIRALVLGTRVLRGQAVTNGQTYQIWREPLRHLVLTTPLSDQDIEILRPIVPDIDQLLNRSTEELPSASPTAIDVMDSEQVQKRLLETIISVVNRQTEPLVIILEDLQWARSESVALIRQLSQFIDNSPLLLLATYRDDELPQLPNELPNAQLLKLSRLSNQAIAELSQSMLGSAGQQPHVLSLLQRETEGNVFFLIEAVRALAEEAGQLERVGMVTLPQHIFTGGMSQIVHRRLNRILPGDYPLLQLAAVSGRQLDLRVLRTASATTDLTGWLLRCADAAVLEIRDEQWRFSHDKLREGILAPLTGADIAALNRRAAETIEATYADDSLSDHASALVEHWRMAGDSQQEYRFVVIAGDNALRVSAYTEATAYFARAFDLLAERPDLDPNGSQYARLVLKRSVAQISLGLYSEATEGLLAVLNRMEASQSSAMTAEVLLLLGRIALQKGQFELGGSYINRSRMIFTEAGAPQGLASTANLLGRLAFFQGGYADAELYFRQGLDIFRHMNDSMGMAQALGGLSNVAMAQSDIPKAEQYVQESLTRYQTVSFRNGVGSAYLTLSWIAQPQGKFDDATAAVHKALQIFREISAPAEVAMAVNNLGYLAMMQKNYQEAQTWFIEGLAISRRIGDQWGVANTMTNLGHTAVARGELDYAWQLFNEAGRAAKALGATPLLLEIVLGIARVEMEIGHMARAAELFGMVTAQPNLDSNIQSIAGPLLDDLQTKLDYNLLAQLTAQGRSQDFHSTLEALFGASDH